MSTRRLPALASGAITLVAIASGFAGSSPAGASPGGQVVASPLGVPAPSSGWTTVFADGFAAPIGSAPGDDNLWYPNEPAQVSPATPTYPDTDFDTNAYSSTEVWVTGGNLIEAARYDANVLPASGTAVQKNYLSGMAATTTINSHSCVPLIRTTACYRGWDWLSAPGPTWAFQVVAQFPLNTGELFNAFWSVNDSFTTSSNERDFIEGKRDLGSTVANDTMLDSDWIYQVSPLLQDLYSQDTDLQLDFNPSAQMNTYTYVIYPDQTWSLYLNGVKQMWIGNGTGIGPAESAPSVRMALRLDYAVRGNTFVQGERYFKISSVAVYEDSASASKPGHPYSSGTTIAPGTTVIP